MKRACILILVLVAATAAEVPTWDLANSHAALYNRWVELRNRPAEFRGDTLPADEFMQWQKVKSAWRQLEKRVDAEYRGNR